MLETQEVVNLLAEKLNDVGKSTDPSYSFFIFAEVGECKEGPDINGVLKTEATRLDVVEDLRYIQYSYSLGFLVPAAFSNFNVLNVKNIIAHVVEELNGKSIKFENGEGTITLTESAPGALDSRDFVGISVPISLSINISYTESAVIASKKKWFLDGKEIVFKTEAVLLEKDGQIHKINDRAYTQTLITGQTKYYKFSIPFSLDNSVATTLQKDILEGNFDKTYTLSYYDGVSFTEAEPFTTTVSIFRNADGGSEKPNLSVFNITFTDVDDGQNEVKYYLALVDWEFGTKGENTRYFNSKPEQQSYFNSLISSGPYCAYFEEIKAPNVDSLFITSQIYKNTLNLDVTNLVNKNYAIIKVEGKNLGINYTKYYYYYVNSARVGAGNQVVYDLELDSVQTYFIGNQIDIPECMITRAHLDRWVETDTSSNVKFNGELNSDLFEREDLQDFAKRLKSRKQISLNTYFEEDEINKWLDDNVQCWMYIFLDPKHKYKTIGADSETTVEREVLLLPADFYNDQSIGTRIMPFEVSESETGYSTYIDSGFIAVCVPIYKSSKFIKIKEHLSNGFREIKLDIDGMTCFWHNNNGDEYNFGRKLSAVPPFNRDTNLSTSYSYEIDEEGNLVLESNITPTTGYFNDTGKIRFVNGYAVSSFYNKYDSQLFYGVYAVAYQSSGVLTKEIELDAKFEYTKTYLTTNWLKSKEFNPKLFSTDYREIKICDQTGEGFSYDLQKLNTNKIRLLYSEPLSPDVSKSYVRIYNPTGVYIAETANNYTGYVGANDLSLTMTSTAYQQMLAQNKNFFMQSTLSAVSSGAQTALGGAIGAAAAGSAIGAVTAGVSAGFGLLGLGVSLINKGKSIDNMKSAPSNIQKATGSALLNMMVSPLGVYIEDYAILPNEQEIVNDYMFKYGYTYNKIGNINDFLNTRKYFNFIQASIETINAQFENAMSNAARTNLIERFGNGIRFWNNQSPDNKWVDYAWENYEINLEN